MKKCTDFRIKKTGSRGARRIQNICSETLRAAADNENRHFKNFPYTSETGAKEANVSG